MKISREANQAARAITAIVEQGSEPLPLEKSLRIAMCVEVAIREERKDWSASFKAALRRHQKTERECAQLSARAILLERILQDKKANT